MSTPKTVLKPGSFVKWKGGAGVVNRVDWILTQHQVSITYHNGMKPSSTIKLPQQLTAITREEYVAYQRKKGNTSMLQPEYMKPRF